MDRTFRLLVRNYWSVFFVVAAVSVPLQVVHATIWRNVIAVSELHADIEKFPPLRQVRGVGVTELHQARVAQWVIWGILIVLLPLFLRATEWIVRADAHGGIPTAAGGWRAAMGQGKGLAALPALSRPGLVAVGAAAAGLVFVLISAGVNALIEPLPAGVTFAGAGLALGATSAAAAPFFLVPAAMAALARTAEE